MYLVLAIIVFGMAIGAVAQWIVGRRHHRVDWTQAIVAGLAGSFIGGAGGSPPSGGGPPLRPPGGLGSLPRGVPPSPRGGGGGHPQTAPAGPRPGQGTGHPPHTPPP